MKTAKQLRDYYYNLKRGTLDDIEYKEELERLKYIVGTLPKPLRTEKENKYINFIESKFFNKSRTIDRCCFELKIKRSEKETQKSLENEILKHFNTFEDAKKWIDKKSKETDRLIDSYFIKYKFILNRLI